MDRQRAERHLRLITEAALRHARTLPSDISGEVRPRDVFTGCVRRFQWAAAALIAVGAVDAGQADVLLDELQAALAVRHLSAINWASAFRPGRGSGPSGRARGAHKASRADSAIGGASPGHRRADPRGHRRADPRGHWRAGRQRYRHAGRPA